MKWKLKTPIPVVPEPALPPKEMRLRAFELCPFESTKVLILGQDPYHTKGMADGLAFSVQPHIKRLPPSLRNVFEEYHNDLSYGLPKNGDLSPWASRGVLLLNTVLSVAEGAPNSHKGIGWERLAYEVVSKLSDEKTRLAFILWGKHAQQFRARIDEARHLVVATPHPSPYSASSGFFGSRPFSKVCDFLNEPRHFWKLP